MNPTKILLPILALLITGCASRYKPNPIAPRPAKIGHIVFLELHDPADLESLRRNAEATLGRIQSVATFAAGSHLDTGRDSVLNDYHLAIYLGFKSKADLAAYVRHTSHTNFVKRWKPKLKSLRVYDMLDEPNFPLGRPW